jgi:hypothetical protein
MHKINLQPGKQNHFLPTLNAKAKIKFLGSCEGPPQSTSPQCPSHFPTYWKDLPCKHMFVISGEAVIHLDVVDSSLHQSAAFTYVWRHRQSS